MNKSRGFTIEFPASARLVFDMNESKLVINPRPAKCEFQFVAGQNYNCGKCGKSGFDAIHQAETSQVDRISGIPETRILDESGDWADQWFAFWEEDCMDPTIWIVRAESWEQAYEDFYNNAVQPLDEATLADYKQDSEGYYEDLTMTDRGWISTESINGCEIELIEVTCR